MMRKIKLTRANKSILLKALAPYYYQEKALGHNTENPGRLILKIDSLPADKKATFSTEEIRLMRITINRLRNERLGKFSHSENDADDANDADIDITQLSGWDISRIASQASLASSAKPWRGKYGA